MRDIQFNPNTREIIFAANGDFAVTENPSTQNGAILLQGRCFNAVQPAAGIGFNRQVQGGPISQAALQLNRWTAQVAADGGTAKWSRLPAPAGQNFDFNATVSYPS